MNSAYGLSPDGPSVCTPTIICVSDASLALVAGVYQITLPDILQER